MALSIKTDEADALARALSERTGETLTAAVTNALRERLNRVSAQNPRRYLDGIDNLAEDFRRHATSGPSDDEIIGYDAAGLPR
ncbi:type II toxin-antitoxin system VapB family antitoxin [Tessaracoccus massiliensis]|uniref:type II toxin-antitoxin system VapB family antitoxin n=1 Tax=Tessaracoccus massiliensis TaxID=1522311 RepID=UPI00058EB24C|nr:type II toxin-antitoxin system VapB family antitoxin [Tessaracoccus massiliensis]